MKTRMEYSNTINWLLEGEDWIRYNTLVHLLGKKTNDPLVVETYQKMRRDPLIENILNDIQDWETDLLKRHNDANHSLHKLSFLAEIGISDKDPLIQTCISKIRNHQSPEGPFQVLSNYPTHFGGSGKNEWLWVLCDAPLIIFSLAKFGYANDPGVKVAFSRLISTVRENGWPCAGCNALGKFRGPGKADDTCPYANLLMLKAAAAFPGSDSKVIFKLAINALLDLWENSYKKRPYLFKMGTDFRKLKVPFIWYDILHVLDVLSKFPSIHKDARYQSMLDVMIGKADQDFRFKSESVWTKWKGWEFCQKKEASRWVTFAALRILKRSGAAAIKALHV